MADPSGPGPPALADEQPASSPFARLDGWWGGGLVFVASLACFAVQSLAWPLVRGRDWQDYLIYWHEVWRHDPLFPVLMLVRMPLTSLIFGPLYDLGGRGLAEGGAGVMFAASVTAWAAAARSYGRKAAITTTILLAVMPGYGWFFHQIGSDPVFAFVLSLLSLGVVRTAAAPTTRRFALLGVGVFLLVMARPAGQPFVLVVLLPLGLAVPWRRRLGWAVVFLLSVGALLTAWSGYNAFRFDDFTVARGGRSGIPFYRAGVVDGIVRVDNGPRARELAAAIEQHLLKEEPYRSWGFDVDEILASKSTWVHDDITPLADGVWGFDDDHRHLMAVGLEAVRRHPASYASGVGVTIAGFSLAPYRGPQVQPGWVGDPQPRDGPSDAVIGAPESGRRLPGRIQNLSVGGVSTVYAVALVNDWALSPSPRFEMLGGLEPVEGVVASPLERRQLVWSDPSDQRRYDGLRADVLEGVSRLPNGARSESLSSVFEVLAIVMPGIGFWLLLTVLVWARWRPRGLWSVALLGLASLGVVLETSLGFPPDPNYSMPFLPVALLLCVATLSRVGVRGRGREA